MYVKKLDLLHFTKTTNGTSNSDSSRGTWGPCSTSNGLSACFAFPDADSRSLHRILATEFACVLSMLADFDFLGHLSERSTITGSVFTNNSYLLCSFGHFCLCLAWQVLIS